MHRIVGRKSVLYDWEKILIFYIIRNSEAVIILRVLSSVLSIEMNLQDSGLMGDFHSLEIMITCASFTECTFPLDSEAGILNFVDYFEVRNEVLEDLKWNVI